MRFCGNCGSRLEDAAALDSQVDLSPVTPQFGAMMGSDLAERLRRAGLEAAGQRRNVTILFADICGFTALAERIDGEDLYHLVQEYIRILAKNVYKYEGVVDKITGDGLMALFGAPISHENNAERAVRASLDMQDELLDAGKRLAPQLGVDLRVRIGLHSGSVIIGGIGPGDLVLNYTAIGDSVNLAHRIEEAATPGTVLVSDAVYRQVRALFDCRQISALNLKGIAHPVAAFQVDGVRQQPGLVRGVEGLNAPMIGRDAELEQLRSAANGLIEGPGIRFALVTGDAGLGKSRLIREFKASLDPAQVRILEGQSLAYRRVSYWLMRDVLYNLLGLPAAAQPAEVSAALHEALAERMTSQQVSEVMPFISIVMGLPGSDPDMSDHHGRMDAGQLRQQIFLALHELLQIEAARKPIVLILEDLHWADEASLELLAFLLDVLRKGPILVLAVSRSVQSGALERAVIWAGQNLSSRFQHIQLQSLSREQSRQLLNLLLSIPNLPDRLREQILLRAAGVPFYLEEILRMLIDQDLVQRGDGRWRVSSTARLAELGVPDTLQELILTRFDRLPPAQRTALQVAAVIGKDFNLSVLSVVLQEDVLNLRTTISSLVEREFIQPQQAFAATYLTEDFTFRHILMSDAIYGTLLRKERSSLHGRVAEAVESLYADRINDQVELLANHYRWSPYLDRAVHYLILAGKKASRNHVNSLARQHFETALELLYQIEYLPDQAFDVHSGLGDCLVFAGEYPEARGHYEWALQATTVERGLERSALQRNIARTFERQGEYDQALAHLTLAETEVETCDPDCSEARAQIWSDTAWIHFRRGGLTEAEALLRRALDLVENTRAFDTIASIQNRLGGIAYSRGDWEQAAASLRRSIAIREAARDMVNLSTLLNNLGLLELEMGEFDSALENLTRSHELKVRLGQTEGIAMALNNLGWLRILRGELDLARQVLQAALDLVRQIGYSSLHLVIIRSFGELHLAEMDWNSALSILNEHISSLEALGDSDQLIDSYRQLGEACLGGGDIETALRWTNKAGKLLESTWGKPRSRLQLQQGEYLLLQGMLALELRDFVSAEHCIQESLTVFETGRSRLHQARAIYQIGRLDLARGRSRQAQEHFDRAAQMFNNIGALLDAARAEQAALQIQIKT